MDKLKNCPFCGGEAELVSGELKPTLEEMLVAEKNAKCSNTGCLARFVVCSVTEWNKRAGQQDSQKHIRAVWNRCCKDAEISWDIQNQFTRSLYDAIQSDIEAVDNDN